eukprot:1337355-Amphidinium_carterae.1
MAYSTCSFNPLENEAVVAALLERTGGAIEVEQFPVLHGLEVRPGLETWKVLDGDGCVLTAYCDVKVQVPKRQQRRYRNSMWPPAQGSSTAKSLLRCARLYPHLKNTGGFFVVILRKKAMWPLPKPSLRPMPVACRAKLHHCSDTVLEELKPILCALIMEAEVKEAAFQLLMRGEHKVYACATELSRLLLSNGKSRPLAAVAVGVCVAMLTDGAWQSTEVAVEIAAACARTSNRKAVAK